MIGPKKLAAIRAELRRAMSATGDDPIRWLEDRMNAPEVRGASVSGEGEILQSLRRVLEGPGKQKRRRRRSTVRK